MNRNPGHPRRLGARLSALLVLALLGTLAATPAGAAPKPQKPPAPTGLHVTAVTQGSVGLAWNASAGATGYRVYRGGKTPLAQVTGTSYTDTTVVAGKTYTYTVSAVNAAGESGKSNPVTVIPQPAPSPRPPRPAWPPGPSRPVRSR